MCFTEIIIGKYTVVINVNTQPQTDSITMGLLIFPQITFPNVNV